jgi:hypothetical protein
LIRGVEARHHDQKHRLTDNEDVIEGRTDKINGRVLRAAFLWKA